MFGYIRPLKEELKVREFDQFKACYCGLCHTLKNEYGVSSRFIINYDFTFLAMLLWNEEEQPSYQSRRCVASPVRKQNYCASSKALSICAGYSVILAWWKLRDSIADERFFKSLRDRFASIIIRRAYRKAAQAFPVFEKTVREQLGQLKVLENSGNGSLDACADKFALITSALADDTTEDEKHRPLEQMLYHLGRFIYIIDACDDLDEDIRDKRFNAVASRFGKNTIKLSDAERDILRTTLLHSCNLIGAAYELLKQNIWSPIIINIIYLGMPEACTRVLNGTWRAKDISKMNKGNGQTI